MASPSRSGLIAARPRKVSSTSSSQEVRKLSFFVFFVCCHHLINLAVCCSGAAPVVTGHVYFYHFRTKYFQHTRRPKVGLLRCLAQHLLLLGLASCQGFCSPTHDKCDIFNHAKKLLQIMKCFTAPAVLTVEYLQNYRSKKRFTGLSSQGIAYFLLGIFQI